MPTLDFEGERRRQKFENCRLKKISEKKIEKYCYATGFNDSEIKRKIDTDIKFRWFFVKDPIRQNIHEKTAMNFIKTINGVKDFKKFGTNEMYIVNGSIVKNNELKNGMIPSCKSIDFYWKYKNTQIYAYHKYTKEPGGHQDNQYEDLKKFIDAANKSTSRNILFLAIADGKFYDTQNGKANTTKIQRLKDLSNNKSTFALTSPELERFLECYEIKCR